MELNNRNFSLVFAAFICLLGWMTGLLTWAIIPAGLSVAIGFVAPNLMEVPKVLFLKLGHVLGRINNFLLLTLLYFILFTLFGLFGRIIGRNLITAKKDVSLKSYWKSKAAVDYKQQMNYQF